MALVRFRDPAGYVRTGDWTDRGLEFGGRVYDPADVSVLPPVEPTKIVAVGRNYRSVVEAEGVDPPTVPRLFFKPPHTVAGHGDTISLPAGKNQVVYEAELGVVIGEQAKRVSRENAESVIAGYTCVNDISNLDDRDIGDGAVRVKGFDGAAPLGPVVVPPTDVPDDATIELRLNGAVKQRGSRADLIFGVPELIEEITRYLTLEPGDVISTGTPGGFGPLSHGDHVAITIDGIGTLEHDVAAAE